MMQRWRILFRDDALGMRRRIDYLCGMVKKDIRQLTLEEIQEYFTTIGEPSFRARQVHEWLWKKSARDFDQMTNISLTTRDKLQNDFVINHIAVDHMQRSIDGTIKNAVKLFDGRIVESVLIPTSKRITACISSQVGCSLDCHFCATGQLKRMRNLNPDEIYDQVVTIKEQSEKYFQRPLTNIVLMGMGEPLLNYQNVLAAIEKITSPDGLHMSPKRITLSTVGVARMIRKLADDEVRFHLAVSLHSAINEIRSSIMPINETNPVEDLGAALHYWYQKTGRKVTLEYVVWKDINDTENDARALVKFCSNFSSKVNLIEYNPIDEGRFRQADEAAIRTYVQVLEKAGIVVNIRRSRGRDIDAACGQLANKS